MKDLVIKNKELRRQIKLFETEFSVIETVYSEMSGVFTEEQENSIINDAKKVLIQDVDEAKIREYLLRHNYVTSYDARLKYVIKKSLEEKM